MSSPTELFLPPTLPYPIKIANHEARVATQVQRGTRLLSYSFTHTTLSPEPKTEVRFGTWDSSIEGTVEKWNFRAGEIISDRKAREAPAIYITEPCKHGVQLGGLCCLCGKDMTDYDYTGFSDSSRASIQMTHLANGPTVSLEEAQRIERETAEHLIKSRKLSLIVDLDQTIVHATVDPTVGEWISEGEAWEARRSKKAESETDNPQESENAVPVADDEVNPNWEALKDVKKFKLGPEALGPPSSRFAKGKTRDKAMEQEGCMYYIKPRPGLETFLKEMAVKYEMHVYTMGTRAYAEEVCAAIDPDGKIFGGRLLSRDESGSLTQKSLQRLFPCDQSMVVIIDDRADVWEWSPNLVKVIPYDFFVGIGDINSTFLPKLEPLAPNVPTGPPPINSGDLTSDATPSLPQEKDEPLSDVPSEVPPASTSTESLPSDPEGLAKEEMVTRNTLALEAQFEERPLAKKQEELQEQEEQQEAAEEAAAASDTNAEESAPAPANSAGTSTVTEPGKEKHPHVRKALLKNDDAELDRVKAILNDIHERFYSEYDSRPPQPPHKVHKRKSSRHQDVPSVPYDVRTIIPRMRMNTLEGVHILFSSVIPLDTRPEATEIWKTALAFGAKCYTELNSRITHVVAAKRGTVKVDAARRRGGIAVVWFAWFTDSIALWRRQDETPYLLEPDAPLQARIGSPPSDPHQISSDPEPDADDWDQVTPAAPARAGVGESEDLTLEDVDWSAINDEVEAAMNESDDDGDESEVSGMRSGNASEDEGSSVDDSNSVHSSGSRPSTPRKRKRLRSLTPSEVGMNGNDSDVLRSPLAKRKKIAMERSGSSKLKEAITADELELELPDEEDPPLPPLETSLAQAANEDEEDEEDEEEDDSSDEMDEEDDFLARELEAEWG